MSQDSEASRVLGLAHGQLCYLQLPAVSGTRAAAFYAAVFGWDIEEHHPDFESPGLIGQWVEGRPPARDGGPMIWLHVADMNETLNRVTAHGGEILEPPSPDGPARTLATIIDPEGNPIGLAGHAQPRLPAAPGREAPGRAGTRPRRHPAAQAPGPLTQPRFASGEPAAGKHSTHFMVTCNPVIKIGLGWEMSWRLATH